MKKFFTTNLLAAVAAFALLAVFTVGCAQQKSTSGDTQKMEQQLKDFIKKYEETMKPVSKDMAEAYFQASVNSNEEGWNKVASLEMKMNAFLSNKETFKELKSIYDSKAVKDPILARQLQLLYNEFMSKQIDTAKLNKLTQMTNAIELKYSKFRAQVGKKVYSDNDVEAFLKSETNSKKLEEVWTAQKEIGPLVAEDIIAIVKLRNEIAKELGFNNYHEMSLKLSDQEPKDISNLFDELDNLTREAFKKVKGEMDLVLAKKCNTTPDALMPWNYQNRFFQEAPQIYDVDLDKYYQGKDLVKLAETYYAGLDLPIDDMVAKSDLYEKPNKNQHAYCINIDRDAKDIRVLCNVKDNADWMGTILHEYGHASYEKYYNQELPWILKTPAHTFTTEAIAMIFGRFSNSPQWMLDMGLIDAAEQTKIADACQKTLTLNQLVFSRWSQVMYRFEKALYENPDQDLNKLWWDLVEQYQMIKRPVGRNKPDWATKIHIATSPCYYHNYHLGELLASQLYYTIANKVTKENPETSLSFVGKKEAGKFLKDNIFGVGSTYSWNEMIEKATGEKLTAKYYAKQFVK